MATSSGWMPSSDWGGGFSTRAEPSPRDKRPLNPEYSQASRALGLASYFASGSAAINLSQFLGSPLYLINEEWYNSWIAFTKQSWGILTMTMTQWWAPTIVRVSGDASMRGQLVRTADGGLICDFPERLALIANHQIYTDWLYLWWIGYSAGMHGRIYVVLKESLKRIPVIGWGMQFAQFIFLKRHWEEDKPGLKKHMQRLNRPKDPMWLMIFPEGTNLASCTRETSRKWALKNGIMDMKHTLLPRARGLQFMLQELRQTVDYVYDCTIAYEGVPHGTFAQDIFTVGASYFGGRPPKSVNMYWRRFKTSQIPIDDPKKFELWLRLRWREKDKFIDHYLRTGRFPADTGSTRNNNGECLHGAGHIESEVRPKYWYEFLQVFAPIGLFALVLYFFYGALPTDMADKVRSIDQKAVMKQVQDMQTGKFRMPETKDILGAPPQHLQDKIDAIKRYAAQQGTTPENVIAEAKKTLPAGALPAGDHGPKPKPKPNPAPTTTQIKPKAVPSKISAPVATAKPKVKGPATPRPQVKASGRPPQKPLKKNPLPKANSGSSSPPKPTQTKKSTTPTLPKKSALSSAPASKKPALSTVKVPNKQTGNLNRSKPKPPINSKPQPRAPTSKLQGPATGNPVKTKEDVVRHTMKQDKRKGRPETRRKIKRVVANKADVK